MFTFDELAEDDQIDTFAYWVLVEQMPIPSEFADLNVLKRWMSYHYDAEEQAYTAQMLRTNDDLVPHYIRFVAPVTLAERWTPFQMAINLLGSPIRAERGEGMWSAAICTFQPKFLGGSEPKDRSEHARHFVFLLRMACSVALRENSRILIIGSPGWSYRYWKDQFYMMNPDTAVLMHEAGYLYTDRIAQ